jgi:hypothetical protein
MDLFQSNLAHNAHVKQLSLYTIPNLAHFKEQFNLRFTLKFSIRTLNCIRDFVGNLCTVLIVCGPGSVVGIATGYGLECLVIESLCRRDFPHLSRPALGPIQPPVQ